MEDNNARSELSGDNNRIQNPNTSDQSVVRNVFDLFNSNTNIASNASTSNTAVSSENIPDSNALLQTSDTYNNESNDRPSTSNANNAANTSNTDSDLSEDTTQRNTARDCANNEEDDDGNDEGDVNLSDDDIDDAMSTDEQSDDALDRNQQDLENIESDLDISDDDETAGNEGIWDTNLTEIEQHDFVESTGPTKTLTASKTEIDFLNLVFPPQLYEVISNETNRYAQERGATNWTETNQNEIKRFLGFHMYMALTPLPCYKDYFSGESSIFKNNMGL